MAVAGPTLILSGADFLAICGLMLLVGFLKFGKGIVHVFFFPFELDIKFIGKPFGGVANKIESALNGWLDSAIQANEKAISELWSGMVWLVQHTAQAIEDTAHYAEQAFDHLTSVTLPREIDAGVHVTSVVAHGATSSIAALAHTIASEVDTLEGKIGSSLITAEQYARAQIHASEVVVYNSMANVAQSLSHDLGATIHGVESALTARVAKLEGSIADQIAGARSWATHEANQAIQGVESEIAGLRNQVTGAAQSASGAVAAAIAAAKTEVNAEIGPILARAQQAVDTATNAASSAAANALRQAETDIARVEGEASAFAASALANARAEIGGLAGTVEDWIAHLPTTIEDELAKFNAPSIAGLLAQITSVAALLSLVMVESGLDNPNCRAKNKGICGTNTDLWESALFGLTALGVGWDLDEIIDTGKETLSLLMDGTDYFGIDQE